MVLTILNIINNSQLLNWITKHYIHVKEPVLMMIGIDKNVMVFWDSSSEISLIPLIINIMDKIGFQADKFH